MLADHTPFRFAATSEAFERALGELNGILDGAGLDRKGRYNAAVVFEEVVTNIVRHGCGNGAEPRVEVSIEIGPEAVLFVFTDDAVAFNPCEHPEPDFFSSLISAKLGGLGISLVRKASTSMTYEQTPDARNRLTVTVAAR